VTKCSLGTILDQFYYEKTSGLFNYIMYCEENMLPFRERDSNVIMDLTYYTYYLNVTNHPFAFVALSMMIHFFSTVTILTILCIIYLHQFTICDCFIFPSRVPMIKFYMVVIYCV